MINSLPDNVLLEIFNICRMGEVSNASDSPYFPWGWRRLAHVCRTWRQTIFASSHYLNLQLLCTYRTPVRKTLPYLPVLPIIIILPTRSEDRGHDEDDDNVLAALEHPDRVRVVELCVPCSLLEKMTQRPFLALTALLLRSAGPATPVLPDAFLGGCAPRLQKIYLEDIPFPAAPTLLSSARDLVEIDFRGIPDTGYISPEAMVASLAALSRLKYLSLGFQSPSYPDQIRQLPTTRAVLPALILFRFSGLVRYLEDFVAQIDAPQLNFLEIAYLDESRGEDVNFQIPQVCKFIDRSENLTQFWRVDVNIQPRDIVVKLAGGWRSLSFELPIRNQGINQVLSQIYGMISNMDRMYVYSWSPTYSGKLGSGIWWLELFRPFTAVKALDVQYKLSKRVALALNNVTGDRAAEILPALELLFLEYQPATSVEEFLAARRKVGRRVTVIRTQKEFIDRLELDFCFCK